MIIWFSSHRKYTKNADFAQNMRTFLRIWSHLLKKFLMENFIFCAVSISTNAIVFCKIIKNCLCSKFAVNEIYAEFFVKNVFRLFLPIKIKIVFADLLIFKFWVTCTLRTKIWEKHGQHSKLWRGVY